VVAFVAGGERHDRQCPVSTLDGAVLGVRRAENPSSQSFDFQSGRDASLRLIALLDHLVEIEEMLGPTEDSPTLAADGLHRRLRRHAAPIVGRGSVRSTTISLVAGVLGQCGDRMNGAPLGPSERARSGHSVFRGEIGAVSPDGDGTIVRVRNDERSRRCNQLTNTDVSTETTSSGAQVAVESALLSIVSVDTRRRLNLDSGRLVGQKKEPLLSVPSHARSLADLFNGSDV